MLLQEAPSIAILGDYCRQESPSKSSAANLVITSDCGNRPESSVNSHKSPKIAGRTRDVATMATMGDDVVAEVAIHNDSR